MSAVGEIQIIVTPEVLVSKSGDLSKRVAEMRVHFQELKDVMDKTNKYWIGDGGDVHRNRYYGNLDNIETILKRLEEHPRDLLTMAGLYEEVENLNTQEGMALPQDVII